MVGQSTTRICEEFYRPPLLCQKEKARSMTALFYSKVLAGAAPARRLAWRPDRLQDTVLD